MVGLAQSRNHPHSVELELWSPSNRTPSREITNLARWPMVSMMMQIDPLKPIYLIDIDFLRNTVGETPTLFFNNKNPNMRPWKLKPRWLGSTSTSHTKWARLTSYLVDIDVVNHRIEALKKDHNMCSSSFRSKREVDACTHSYLLESKVSVAS
jgi:hypothetical protein